MTPAIRGLPFWWQIQKSKMATAMSNKKGCHRTVQKEHTGKLPSLDWKYKEGCLRGSISNTETCGLDRNYPRRG
jgi:hypothetical protein